MNTTNVRTKMTAEQRIASRQQRAQRHAKQRQQEEQHLKDSLHPVYQDEDGFDYE